MPVSLVFGASGAIGRFLVPQLLAAGHGVIAPSRATRASGGNGLEWIVGRLPDAIPELPRVDTIFSVGPLDAFAAWLSIATGIHEARIVAIGSLSARTKTMSVDPAERALAERLRHAEQSLADAADARGCAWTVLRPTLIYGAGMDRSLTPIVRFARRTHVFPTLAGARGLRQPVHAADVADACIAAAASESAHRRAYELGGGERLAFGAMLDRVRASLGDAVVALPVPLAIARAGAQVARRLPAFRAAGAGALARLNEDLVADHDAAIADFGWSPRGFHPGAPDWTPPPLP